MANTVHISALSKGYGAVRALDRVDLALGTGITGLLGPNGAGKTTLLRCLATTLAPDSGQIRALGLDPARGSDRTLQRLVLAQALLGDPDLLVLDEPTVGLDPEQRLRFRALLSHLGETRTALVSTHQTEDVAAMCERVVVLLAGVVRFDGTPAELAATAAGQVWLADSPPQSARIYWRTAAGRYRILGEPPPGSELAEPQVEDGYLLLAGDLTAVAT